MHAFGIGGEINALKWEAIYTILCSKEGSRMLLSASMYYAVMRSR